MDAGESSHDWNPFTTLDYTYVRLLLDACGTERLNLPNLLDILIMPTTEPAKIRMRDIVHAFPRNRGTRISVSAICVRYSHSG